MAPHQVRVSPEKNATAALRVNVRAMPIRHENEPSVPVRTKLPRKTMRKGRGPARLTTPNDVLAQRFWRNAMRAPLTVVVSLSILGWTGPLAGQSMTGGRMNENQAGFGISLAIVENDVLIGEPSNRLRPGTIYVYRRSGGSWRESMKLTATDGRPGDFFGASMSSDGQHLLVGATRQNEDRGAVYVFERNGTNWRESARLVGNDVGANEGFGASVLVRGDLVVVGAPNQSRQTGAVYVFRRSGSSWTQVARLVSSDPRERAQFGVSLALAGDALLIGEPGTEQGGGVRVFQADPAGGWKETGRIAAFGVQRGDAFGARIHVQGDVLLISASGSNANAGIVYQFRRHESGEWREFRRLSAFESGRNDLFGVALAQDANQVWVGAPRQQGHGTAHVFSRNPGDSTWSTVERITSKAAERGDAFGSNLAVRGNLAAVGMTSDDNGLGTVVIFERANAVWRESAVLKVAEERYASVTGRKAECTDGKASSFECRDYDLVSFLSVPDLGGARGSRLSGNWGWTDPETNREYALIGRTDGTSFVDVTNAEKPVYLGDLPRTEGAHPSSWREIKTYKNWALIVSDGSGPHGIQFFDLTRLRDVKAPVKFQPDHTYRNLASIHNIVVNEEAGLAAAVGANGGGETCGGGLHMLDIKDPKNPTFVGCFADTQTGRASTGYSHDALCITYRGPDQDYQGREICLGSNETKLSIADVTDRKAPRAIARAGYPSVGYTHQGWYDAEQRYFYMNDELDETGGLVRNTRTIIWDLSDLDDPQVVGEFLGTTQASDHNLYVVGNLMYQSNYQAGLRVIDITDRKNPVEVGFFDTVPYGANTPGFGGSWNNYPFFKSGNIMVSSGAEGMFLVRKKAPKVVS
jgi:choice-of-anchor B domain-containing protein